MLQCSPCPIKWSNKGSLSKRAEKLNAEVETATQTLGMQLWHFSTGKDLDKSQSQIVSLPQFRLKNGHKRDSGNLNHLPWYTSWIPRTYPVITYTHTPSSSALRYYPRRHLSRQQVTWLLITKIPQKIINYSISTDSWKSCSVFYQS